MTCPIDSFPSFFFRLQNPHFLLQAWEIGCIADLIRLSFSTIYSDSTSGISLFGLLTLATAVPKMAFSQDMYPIADKQALLSRYSGERVTHLPTPACIVNRKTFQKNCKIMRSNADALSLPFRAHIKTHKTREGVELQLDPDANGKSTQRIVVSTIMEAVSMLPLVEQGVVSDILYGLPLVTSKLPELIELSESVQVRLMIDSVAQVTALLSHKTRQRWSVFVKVDCGTHRAGLPVHSEELNRLIALILHHSKDIELFGFYCHAGHSYDVTSEQQAKDVLMSEIQHAKAAALLARDLDAAAGRVQKYTLSVGATPTARISSLLTASELADQLKTETASDAANLEVELHAGCYPMNDLQQVSTRLIDESAVAIRVLAEVVSTYPSRGTHGEVLINAGTLALSKETSARPGYGQAHVDSDVSRQWIVDRTSQEHGILVPNSSPRVPQPSSSSTSTSTSTSSSSASLILPSSGEKVLIVPQHACITSGMYAWYYVVDEDGFDARVVDIWPRFNGW